MVVPNRNDLTAEALASKITNDLFLSNDAFKTTLIERYAKMASCICCDPEDAQWHQANATIRNTPGREDARLQIVANSIISQVDQINELFLYPNFGFDLPIWLEMSENCDHRVMLITQDPKRVDDVPGIITFSSPFGLHCSRCRRNRVGQRMSSIVEMLCDNSCAVYLTDVTKFYAQGDRMVGRLLACMNETFHSFLVSEITMFNPTEIITFGEKASMALDPEMGRNFQDRALNGALSGTYNGLNFRTLLHLSHQNDAKLRKNHLNPDRYYLDEIRRTVGM